MKSKTLIGTLTMMLFVPILISPSFGETSEEILLSEIKADLKILKQDAQDKNDALDKKLGEVAEEEARAEKSNVALANLLIGICLGFLIAVLVCFVVQELSDQDNGSK